MDIPPATSSRDDWIAYIARLNDRHIARKTASGYTQWALLGAIALLIYNLVGNLYSVSVTNIPYVVVDISLFFNAGFVIVMLWVLISHDTSRARLMLSALQQRSSLYFFAAAYGVLTAYIAVNIYIALVARSIALPAWNYWIPSIFGVLNTGSAVWLDFVIRRKTKTSNLPPVYPHVALSTRWSPVVAIVVVAIGSYPALERFTVIAHSENDVQVAMELVACLALLVLIVVDNLAAMSGQWLEQFERRIILDGMNSADIRSEFIEGFVGRNVAEWFRERHKRIMELLDQHDVMVGATDVDIRELIAAGEDPHDRVHEAVRDLDQILQPIEGILTEIDEFIDSWSLTKEEHGMLSSLFAARRARFQQTKELWTRKSHEWLEPPRDVT